ncbi:MAG: ATP-binding protein [Vicinamibacterales bacterium]
MTRLSSVFASEKPSRRSALIVGLILVLAWSGIRLVVFRETVFPLTYVIPLLVGVWSRDRAVLWTMAAAFAILHTMKMVWLLSDAALTEAEWWANYSATMLNIVVGAAIVQMVIVLRDSIDRAMEQLREQAEELRVQTEELSQQNEELTDQGEELSQQTEELSRQSEELAQQNEELHLRSDEIRMLNTTLERREALLQTLLDTTMASSSEEAALEHIASAARELFGDVCCAIGIYEQADGPLALRATAPRHVGPHESSPTITDDFVSLVLHANRTAAINDIELRPDLRLANFAMQLDARAVLCAPIALGAHTAGAFAVYSARAHEWSDEEFRLASWCAHQSGRLLQTLRLQAELRDRDQRKSEFLATLSHELRNPLAPMGFALKLVEQNTEANNRPMLVMRRQFQQLVRLVDDLLDATRLSQNKVQVRRTRCDLVSVVRQAVDAAQPNVQVAGHTLTLVLPQTSIWLEGDADRLNQVVMNLLNNAIRYTPSAGRITLTLGITGSEAVLSVADTGIGLHAADLQRVFDMFTQVAAAGSGGLGIGLSLVRGIVQLHDGRVEAHSQGVGKGSEFRVFLPLSSDAVAPAGDAIETVSTLGRSPVALRVLVVDDNADSAALISDFLTLQGHTVRTEYDATNALAAAADFNPHTALLDIGLPGMDGYELARRLRANDRTRNVRLIAVTGWGQDGDRARAKDAGFDAHLTKPADPDRILAVLRHDNIVDT